MNRDAAVVVVGAGPVGLLTAIELALGGACPVVLERLTAPSTIIKALAIGPLGSEALQRRGLRAAMANEEARNLAAMGKTDILGRMSKFGGHFAGLPIRKDVQREPERRACFIGQQGLEALLAERARALGIEVRRGCEVTGVAQAADAVEVAFTSAAGREHIRCSWLVGCDGGRSAVRKMAGFAFPGTPPTMTMYQAIAEIDHPERLLPVGWHRTSRGMFVCGPVPGRLFMIDFSGPPADRSAPVTREEVEAALRRISDEDVRLTRVEAANRWTDNTRLVETYRQGRVLLAGDAAHVHSPFGGQGLSLGLVDGANLGWKLAAVIRGDVPECLLDTYTAERRPVAAAVLANTLAQAAIMRPDPQSGAMRDLVADLLQHDEVARSIGETMSGLSTRYDLGSRRDAVGRLIGDRPIGADDVPASLYEAMCDGRGVLLDASVAGAASELVAATARRVRCVAVADGPSVLIRPDGCIAWESDGCETNGLDEALVRWFGRAPANPHAALSGLLRVA